MKSLLEEITRSLENFKVEDTSTDNCKYCPRCGAKMSQYPAISRRDNKTEICSDCGTCEAFEDAGFVAPYDGSPYWIEKVDESLTEGKDKIIKVNGKEYKIVKDGSHYKAYDSKNELVSDSTSLEQVKKEIKEVDSFFGVFDESTNTTKNESSGISGAQYEDIPEQIIRLLNSESIPFEYNDGIFYFGKATKEQFSRADDTICYVLGDNYSRNNDNLTIDINNALEANESLTEDKKKKFDQTYVSGGRFRDRDASENTPWKSGQTVDIKVKLPDTWTFTFSVHDGTESDPSDPENTDRNFKSDSLCDIEAESDNNFESKLRELIIAEIAKQLNTTSESVRVGGGRGVMPSSMHVREVGTLETNGKFTSDFIAD